MDLTLLGEVERVTYENEETGFRVLQLRAVDGVPGRKVLTVVGVVPAVGKGARVRVSGQMQTDPRHGERLRAESLVVLDPESLAGIEKYLSSGVVSGVGPGFALRIVKYFGKDTLAVMDQEPHRLAEVPGIGAARVQQIQNSWQEHRALSNVLLALTTAGATPALAQRIVRQYGAQALEIVQRTPYRLALEVVGVGFKTADAIAQKQGVGREHPERMQAGLLHELGALSDSGHCLSSHSELLDRAGRMLGVDEGPVRAGLDALWAAGRVVIEGEDVFLTRLHQAETLVSERVARLIHAPAHRLPHLEAALEKFEAERGIQLAKAQRQAVVLAALGKFVVITGGPGVGKTTIVQAILAAVAGEKLRVALAAPTGRAAKRLTESTGHAASTIHRLLEVEPRSGGFQRTADNPLEVDLLVVDEASMLDLRLAESLLTAVPDAARVVLVGDVDQLPSVGPGAVLADIIDSGAVPVARLDVIFRQAEESGIVANAHRILRGEPLVGADGPDGDFFVIKASEPARARDLIVQLVTERIPQRFQLDPLRDVQVLSPMHRGEAGTVALNRALQEALNPVGPGLASGEVVLRQGDKVLQTKNDYDKGVFNGDVGEVIGVDLAAGSLAVQFEDERGSRVTSYQRSELTQLSLAYATSIHKSQGSEFAAVVIPLLTSHFVMLSRNLLYTAITRAKRLCVLVADPRALRIAQGAQRKEARQTRLRARIAAQTERARVRPGA